MRLVVACAFLAACTGSTSPTLTDALHPGDGGGGADAWASAVDSAGGREAGEDASGDGSAALCCSFLEGLAGDGG